MRDVVVLKVRRQAQHLRLRLGGVRFTTLLVILYLSFIFLLVDSTRETSGRQSYNLNISCQMFTLNCLFTLELSKNLFNKKYISIFLWISIITLPIYIEILKKNRKGVTIQIKKI